MDRVGLLISTYVPTSKSTRPWSLVLWSLGPGSPGAVVPDPWTLVPGVVVPGPWIPVPWSLVPGAGAVVPDLWTLVPGAVVPDLWTLVPGAVVPGSWCRGPWTLVLWTRGVMQKIGRAGLSCWEKWRSRCRRHWAARRHRRRRGGSVEGLYPSRLGGLGGASEAGQRLVSELEGKSRDYQLSDQYLWTSYYKRSGVPVHQAVWIGIQTAIYLARAESDTLCALMPRSLT